MITKQDMSPLLRLLVNPRKKDMTKPARVKEWGLKKSSAISITGRIVLNVWRLMRSELLLTSFTFENMAFHVLHRRVPKFSHRVLSDWFGNGYQQWRTIHYYLDRVVMTMHILDETNLIGRTSGFAKVFGIEFFAVINRGSQFKVKSMMLRIGKPENFITISPGRAQVAKMRAIECLPSMDRFFSSGQSVVCHHAKFVAGRQLCQGCLSNPQQTMSTVTDRARETEKRSARLAICALILVEWMFPNTASPPTVPFTLSEPKPRPEPNTQCETCVMSSRCFE